MPFVFYLAVLLGVAAPSSYSQSYRPFYQLNEQELSAELLKLHAAHPDFTERLAAISERFLNTPYRLGPLGEGPAGEYDREPLYDLSAVDCTTFIEQALAMSLEPRWDKAVKTLQKIRYRSGKISYHDRNHFTEIDWIAQNASAGYLEDITEAIGGENTRRAAKTISKRRWYENKTLADLQGFKESFSPRQKERLLSKMRESGKNYQDVPADLPYIPLDKLPEILPRIPSGTILNLVREDNPEQAVMITHQALLIIKEGIPLLRHAAFGKKVEDVPALEYFYRYFGSKWRLIGINLNRDQPQSARQAK